MQPVIQVVGHTTATKLRVLAAFEGIPSGTARLAFNDGTGPKFVDVPLRPAPPYALAVFDLSGLTASATVQYASVAGADAASLPAAGALLAPPNVPSVRLLPSDRPLRVALVSCNDIHQSAVAPPERRGALWKALLREVKDQKVDLILHAGDQIYGDEAPDSWNPSTEDRTAAYRRHYVETWGHPEVAAVLSSCPSMMMWDDHEIYDGWGSNDTDTTPGAIARFGAAEQAFREFQAALNPQPFDASSFAWSFRYRELGVIAVDGRKNRSWAQSSMLGSAQLDAFDRELQKLSDPALDLRHLFIVVGTPPVFLETMAAEKLVPLVSHEALDDIRDGWTSSRNRNECRRFLMSLLSFAARSPNTQVTILGGDIHVGSLGQIDTTIPFADGRTPRIYQVTSSGIARKAPDGFAALGLKLLTNGGSTKLFNDEILGSLRNIDGSDGGHLVIRRNFAILKSENRAGNALDSNGNLWVEFFTEIAGGVQRLEQMLPRLTT